MLFRRRRSYSTRLLLGSFASKAEVSDQLSADTNNRTMFLALRRRCQFDYAPLLGLKLLATFIDTGDRAAQTRCPKSLIVIDRTAFCSLYSGVAMSAEIVSASFWSHTHFSSSIYWLRYDLLTCQGIKLYSKGWNHSRTFSFSLFM